MPALERNFERPVLASSKHCKREFARLIQVIRRGRRTHTRLKFDGYPDRRVMAEKVSSPVLEADVQPA